MVKKGWGIPSLAFAAGVAFVVLHLGVFGAAAWEGWTASGTLVILALAALKVLLLGGHALFRPGLRRARKSLARRHSRLISHKSTPSGGGEP